MPPPRKKDRLRGSLSPVQEQFPPTGTLCGGQADLPGKSRPDEGSKTAPGGGRRLRPWENGGHRVRGDAGKRLPGLPARTKGIPGAKTAPSGGRELCADCAHGRAADIMCGVVPGRHRTGRPPGQMACLGTKNSPRRRPGTVRRLRHGGNGGQWEVSGVGKYHTGLPAGAEDSPGRKNSPRRGPEAVWMRDMGVTCPGRSV